MTLTEMRERADKALKCFLEAMPDCPFGTDDIIFDFAPPSKMAARYKALCAEYRPREIILKEHEEQLADGIGGQAVIGEGKSAVLICTKQPRLKSNLRRVIFHELVHIYCAKTETNGEHFIDTYGSGKPYDEKNEALCDGYFFWSEFIADYISYGMARQGELVFESVRENIIRCVDEIIIGVSDTRRDFVWVCLNILTAYEPEKVLNRVRESGYIITGGGEYADMARETLSDCLRLLYEQTKKEQPWKISKDFISDLGKYYLRFVNYNTMFRLKSIGIDDATLHAFLQQRQKS